MVRRSFIKALVIAPTLLSLPPNLARKQLLPPLSPTNGGRSILPSLLKVGDIILSTTKHFSSAIIRSQTDLPISHARIVYDISTPANPEFFEAVQGGVRIVKYADCMRDDSFSVAVRKTTFNTSQVGAIQNWLMGKIGSDYDLGGVFEEWLALKIKWLDNVRSVALGNPKKFYCSELVAEAYRSVGLHLLDYQNGMPNRSSAPGRFVQMLWFDQLSYVGHLKY